jgi:glycosyltransferase involved in cell wall biosynthesis
MRVAIDLLLAEKEPGGPLFSARALLEGLARIDKTNEYIIITARPQEYQALAAAPNILIHQVPLRSWKGVLLQHQVLLPSVLRKLRPDVLHTAAFAAPLAWQGTLVVTVHDLAFLKVPEQSSLYGRLYWQHLLRRSVRGARHIIAISQQTRDELVTRWAVRPERIHIVHNALRASLQGPHIDAGEIRAMQQRYGRRYLLHVGRIMPRKNVETLLQAFDLVAAYFEDLHLVLTGGVGYASAEVLRQIAESPYYDRIHLAGWVSDHDLGVLYAGASALVFPSRHEGFGLPTVEAMACGAPVVASPEAASVEIAGEAVIRADCSAPAPLADAIAQLLTNEALRERLIGLGKTQVQSFTIEATAEATRRVYQRAFGIDEPLAQPMAPGAPQRGPLAETHPRVSVIVPASRVELASEALESLSRQRYIGEIEIIVVGLCADELARLWPITAVNPGCTYPPGKTRNVGALRASGDILLFLDDDCTVAEDWVERNVRALQRLEIGAVGARIRGKSRAFFARCTDYTNFGYCQHGRVRDELLAAASLGIHRALFQMVGGFDETMRYGEEEDTDLCHRIQRLRYRTVYQPDIVVTHDHRRDTLGKLLGYNYTHGLSSGLTAKIHYREIGLKNRLLFSVRFPLVFLPLLPFIAAAATVRIVGVNVLRSPDVLLCAPLIYLAKLVYEFGVFRWLMFPQHKAGSSARESSPAQASH